MPPIPTPMWTHPLGGGAALVPRTAALAEAYHELVLANQDRLARWEPWAGEPQTVEGTRAYLEAAALEWIDGLQLPVVVAEPDGAGVWHLLGSLLLRIDRYKGVGEVGYWVDGDHEGRGLVLRGVAVLLDEAFGPLGLAKVDLHTDVANDRSRALARRLGFVEEGVLRSDLPMPDGRRDTVVYGLLAGEWARRRVAFRPHTPARPTGVAPG